MRATIFIADDHPIVRHGLAQLINDQLDMQVIGEAATGDEALASKECARADLLVLDLSLPGTRGVDVLKTLRRTTPKLKIVVLSMYPEEQYAPQLLAEGAAAYVSKSLPPAQFLDVLRVVLRTGRYVSPAIERPVVADRPLHASLSAREYQVFTLLYQGKTVSEIAAELDISVSTTSNHLSKVKEKLHARSVGEIVAYAIRAGLVD